MNNIAKSAILVKQVISLLAGANITTPVSCLADRYPYIPL